MLSVTITLKMGSIWDVSNINVPLIFEFNMTSVIKCYFSFEM